MSWTAASRSPRWALSANSSTSAYRGRTPTGIKIRRAEVLHGSIRVLEDDWGVRSRTRCWTGRSTVQGTFSLICPTHLLLLAFDVDNVLNGGVKVAALVLRATSCTTWIGQPAFRSGATTASCEDDGRRGDARWRSPAVSSGGRNRRPGRRPPNTAAVSSEETLFAARGERRPSVAGFAAAGASWWPAPPRRSENSRTEPPGHARDAGRLVLRSREQGGRRAPEKKIAAPPWLLGGGASLTSKSASLGRRLSI